MLLCRSAPGRLATVLLYGAIGVAFPLLWGTSVLKLGEADYILSLILMGIGLNIVLGFAGQVFLGPSALFAVGGYAAALVASHTSYTSLFDLCIVAIVVAVALAAVIAALTLRVGGFYLGMVTLFVSLAIPAVTGVWSYTGSETGLSLLTVLTFTQRPSGYALYLVGVGLVALMTGYAYLIKSSRMGRRFGSIMASEDMAQSLAVAPYFTKLWSFLLAAVPIGLAGGFYVYSQQFISPDSVSVQTSIYVIAGVVVGGAGTIVGPVIGVALIGIALQLLNNFNQYEGLVYGVVLIIVAILMPSGILGLYRDLLVRFMSRALGPPRRLQALAATAAGRSSPESDPTPSGARSTTEEEGGPVEAPPGLVARGVRRRFGGVTALDGVDLEVARGEVHALVGPNGSGKTTLLNVITGYYRADEGTITIGGTRLDQMRSTTKVAAMGVARTFQTPKLNPVETVVANVVAGADRASGGTLFGTLAHTPKALAEDRRAHVAAFSVLNDVGLSRSAFEMATMIPHGTQRLLEIARAMATDPMFVLLDEPAAGLSLGEAEYLKDAVATMARAGLGVLIVEHNLPIVFEVADVVTVLDEGRVIAEGTPAEVSADPEVIRVYIGRRHPTPATTAPGAS